MMQRRLREEELRILRGQAKVRPRMCRTQPARFITHCSSLTTSFPSRSTSRDRFQLAGAAAPADGGGGRPVGAARAAGRRRGRRTPRGGGMEADPNVTGG